MPYKNSSDMMVHRGFYENYLAVETQVIESMRPLIEAHPTAKIMYTGHSLGAAISTFAAVDV